MTIHRPGLSGIGLKPLRISTATQSPTGGTARPKRGRGWEFIDGDDTVR
jgi:hypothetical protein